MFLKINTLVNAKALTFDISSYLRSSCWYNSLSSYLYILASSSFLVDSLTKDISCIILEFKVRLSIWEQPNPTRNPSATATTWMTDSQGPNFLLFLCFERVVNGHLAVLDWMARFAPQATLWEPLIYTGTLYMTTSTYTRNNSCHKRNETTMHEHFVTSRSFLITKCAFISFLTWKYTIDKNDGILWNRNKCFKRIIIITITETHWVILDVIWKRK